MASRLSRCLRSAPTPSISLSCHMRPLRIIRIVCILMIIAWLIQNRVPIGGQSERAARSGCRPILVGRASGPRRSCQCCTLVAVYVASALDVIPHSAYYAAFVSLQSFHVRVPLANICEATVAQTPRIVSRRATDLSAASEQWRLHAFCSRIPPHDVPGYPHSSAQGRTGFEPSSPWACGVLCNVTSSAARMAAISYGGTAPWGASGPRPSFPSRAQRQEQASSIPNVVPREPVPLYLRTDPALVPSSARTPSPLHRVPISSSRWSSGSPSEGYQHGLRRRSNLTPPREEPPRGCECRDGPYGPSTALRRVRKAVLPAALSSGSIEDGPPGGAPKYLRSSLGARAA